MPASRKGDKKDKGTPGPNILTGVYMFPNGDKYDGEYIIVEEGGLQRHGNGEHQTTDGLVYQGQWNDDKMNGKGKLSHPSGAVYEGDFLNNMFHGFGRYTWPDGSCYQGNFNENKLEGAGEFTDTSHQIWYGTFTHKAAPGLRFKLNP